MQLSAREPAPQVNELRHLGINTPASRECFSLEWIKIGVRSAWYIAIDPVGQVVLRQSIPLAAGSRLVDARFPGLKVRIVGSFECRIQSRQQSLVGVALI